MSADEWGEWAGIVRLLRGYALRKYGDDVEGITLRLRHRGETYEPFPIGPPAGGQEGRPAAAENTAGPPPGPRPQQAPATNSPTGAGSPAMAPWHSSDWRLVDWPGLGRFVFSHMQGRVVSALWDARAEGAPGLPQADLLRIAGSDSIRLCDVFKRHPAWGSLIVRGPGVSIYRLADLPAGLNLGGGGAETDDAGEAGEPPAGG